MKWIEIEHLTIQRSRIDCFYWEEICGSYNEYLINLKVVISGITHIIRVNKSEVLKIEMQLTGAI